MRRFVASVALLGFLALLAAPQLEAQEPPHTYAVVEVFDVLASDAPAFETGIKDFVALAGTANLDPSFRREVYQRDNRYWLVSFRENMASFDDPEAFMEAFQASGHGDAAAEAMASFGGLQFSASSEVLRLRMDWSYLPENPMPAPGEHGGVYVVSQWMRPGHEEAFGESAEGFMAMLKEAGGTYPVFTHQVTIGELGRVDFVVLFDELAKFHGEKSLMNLLQEAGTWEQWMSRESMHRAHILKTESVEGFYRPELSYMPMP